jgi:hypothetical protein
LYGDAGLQTWEVSAFLRPGASSVDKAQREKVKSLLNKYMSV